VQTRNGDESAWLEREIGLYYMKLSREENTFSLSLLFLNSSDLGNRWLHSPLNINDGGHV
jgi:hypothetical protein